MFWQSIGWMNPFFIHKRRSTSSFFWPRAFLMREKHCFYLGLKKIKIKPKSVFIHIHQPLDSLKCATNKNSQAAKHIKWNICCLWKQKLPEIPSRLKYCTAYIKAYYLIKTCQCVLIDDNCLICEIIYWKRLLLILGLRLNKPLTIPIIPITIILFNIKHFNEIVLFWLNT